MSSTADDVAMKGGGYYSLATKGAKDVIDGATPLVLEAIERMAPAAANGAFTLADMGCADGGTSADMMVAAVEYLRRTAPGRPVRVVYADQLRNDYNALFRNVQGVGARHRPGDGTDTVFVHVSATSFYQPILPPESLDFGFSATAMHWLSTKPCDIPDHVHAVGAEGAELAAFVEQGRRDWETILLHRAAELVPGGRLVLINFCRDEMGRYLGNTGGVNMFDCFDAIWRDFLADGIIERDEYVAMTLPQYYNTVEEFSAPLDHAASPVYRAGLRLESVETRVVPCPFAAEFRHHGDAGAFARSYIPTLRSWTESTFYGALSGTRPREERHEIIERYYAAYEAAVREAPESHAMDYVHAYLTLHKV